MKTNVLIFLAKAIATVSVTIASMKWMDMTGGVSGIGWLVFALIIIW